MCNPPEKIVIINGIQFRDVTNETVGIDDRVINYEEALAYTRGEIISTSK